MNRCAVGELTTSTMVDDSLVLCPLKCGFNKVSEVSFLIFSFDLPSSNEVQGQADDGNVEQTEAAVHDVWARPGIVANEDEESANGERQRESKHQSFRVVFFEKVLA